MNNILPFIVGFLISASFSWYITVACIALRYEFSFRRDGVRHLMRRVLLVAWLDDAQDRYHDRKEAHER